MGKGGTARFRQVWIAESNASEPLRKCRNALRRRQNRGCPSAPGSAREETCQLPERRPACRRRERNPGSCAERGNLPADAKGAPRSGRVPKRRRRGGAARSSEEGSAMERERRGRPGSLGRGDNRRYREDRERESTSRPLGWPGRDEPCEGRLSRTILRDEAQRLEDPRGALLGVVRGKGWEGAAYGLCWAERLVERDLRRGPRRGFRAYEVSAEVDGGPRDGLYLGTSQVDARTSAEALQAVPARRFAASPSGRARSRSSARGHTGARKKLRAGTAAVCMACGLLRPCSEPLTPPSPCPG